jgi:hypothetical protein
MQAAKTAFSRPLLFWGIPVVVGHLLVVLWHLFLLVKVEPNPALFLPPLLVLINVIPVAGLFVFQRGFFTLAATMVAVPLAVALVIGAYSHFLSSGGDNIFRLPPGEFRLSYQISAVLLVTLEALGCWIVYQMLRNATGTS